MKVSIITTCYNRVKTIRDAIESVKAQTYEDIEYIIVDGASTDGSVEVIKTAIAQGFNNSGGVKFISEPDGGMYEAVNKGLNLATGDVVGLLHSDDMFYDNHVVADIVDDFHKKDNVDFVYGDGLFVNPDDVFNVVRKWIGGRFSTRKVKHGWLPLHPTCYVRRNILNFPKPYNEKYKIAADTDFLIKTLLREDIQVRYLPRYIVRMRMGGLSTDSKRRKQMWKEDMDIFLKNGFKHPLLTKLEKMMWKVPQFIKAKFI